MDSHTLSPDWITDCFNQIIKDDDPEQLDALLHLLAAIAPTAAENRPKYEAAMVAIDFGYRQTKDCDRACREFLGLAV